MFALTNINSIRCCFLKEMSSNIIQRIFHSQLTCSERKKHPLIYHILEFLFTYHFWFIVARVTAKLLRAGKKNIADFYLACMESRSIYSDHLTNPLAWRCEKREQVLNIFKIVNTVCLHLKVQTKTKCQLYKRNFA